jgi:hypothetical protein
VRNLKNLIKQKIFIFLLNLGCIFNSPLTTAFVVYLSLFKSKKIRFNKNYKKTAIIMYRANGIDDVESAFQYYKSKNKILFLERIYLKKINSFFTQEDKITIHQYLKNKRNEKYFIFLSKFVKWLRFFLGNIYFVSFNFAFSEEFNLRDICFKKKILYLLMYKECVRTKGNYNSTFKIKYKDAVNLNKNILKISVYNDDMKKELIKNNIFNKNQIYVTGMPRSSYSQKKEKKIIKKNIVFFLTSERAGIPVDRNLLPNKIKDLNWSDINESVLQVFRELSERYPMINFIIKSKAGLGKKDQNKIKNNIKNLNIKFYQGGAGHSLIKSSFVVIAFNSTTVYEAILNGKKVIIPYLKKYKNKTYRDYILEYPKHLCVESKKELVKKIEATINNKKLINAEISKKESKLIKKYLGNIKMAPKNMRQFLNI